MANNVIILVVITSFFIYVIKIVVALNNLGFNFNSIKVVSLKKTGLYIIIYLVEYEVSLNKRPLKKIYVYLQLSIKNSNHTKAIKIQVMSKDNWQNYCYFIFIATHI